MDIPIGSAIAAMIIVPFVVARGVIVTYEVLAAWLRGGKEES